MSQDGTRQEYYSPRCAGVIIRLLAEFDRRLLSPEIERAMRVRGWTWPSRVVIDTLRRMRAEKKITLGHDCQGTGYGLV